jgi:hypothetical protein
MPKEYRVIDLVKFILKHRRGTRAFQNYSIRDIVDEIQQARQVNGLGFVEEDSQITGVATAFPSGRKLYVSQILVITKKARQSLLSEALKRFSNHTIVATKRGKPKVYPLTLLQRSWETTHHPLQLTKAPHQCFRH